MSAPLPAETNCEAYERTVPLLVFIVQQQHKYTC